MNSSWLLDVDGVVWFRYMVRDGVQHRLYARENSGSPGAVWGRQVCDEDGEWSTAEQHPSPLLKPFADVEAAKAAADTSPYARASL